jgi:hypothetical protein
MVHGLACSAKRYAGSRSRDGRATVLHRSSRAGDLGLCIRNEVKSYVFAPEASVPDVYDSKPHGYRYSRYACSAETCISCPQPKSLALFPSLLL